MNNDKILIERKDGITYEREQKKIKLPIKLTLRLNEEERDKLLSIANKSNTSYAKIIRLAIQRYLKEQEQ